jgi:hypothetical protein
LLDGDESTVRPTANTFNGAPSIRIGRGGTDQHRCGRQYADG